MRTCNGDVAKVIEKIGKGNRRMVTKMAMCHTMNWYLENHMPIFT